MESMATSFVPSDLLQIALLAEPQIAPDGRAVYYRRTWFDLDANEIRGAIRRVDRDGRDRAFSAGMNDRSPRVAPDGSALAFIAERDAGPTLRVLPLDGGEGATYASGHAKISALAWSPDATHLAYVATAPHEPAHARAFLDEPSGARHIRMLPFKSDNDGLLDGTRRHLFLLEMASGTSRQLTFGDYDVQAPTWAPDGKRIAFSARTTHSETATALSDIHTIGVAGGALTTLTDGSGPFGFPAWSHDGKEIACIGHRNGDDGGGRFDDELLVLAASGGVLRSLTADLGRTVHDAVGGDLRSGAGIAPVWGADDREIFVQVSDEGATSVRAFPRAGGIGRVAAGGERQVFAFSVADDGTLAIAYATPTVPNELALVEPYGGERTLTDTNPWLRERTLVTPQRLRPKADDGTTLDAWLLMPAVKREAAPPLVLEVHGGPHAAYGWTFFGEFQVLAAQGIAVVYGNPRGSQSYGAPYANAIVGDWGGIDADDVLRILDGALAAATFDRDRIGVAGGSYGGFMATWLLGHSDRFAAGVSMRAVNDFVSEIGASDIGWFLENELAVRYADDAGQKMFERSPIRGASKITAPLLIDHSERDYRCPIDQGEQLFTTLRRLGRNAEFVRFADTGHELSRNGKPRSRVLRYRAIANWFVRHLRPAGVAAPSTDAGGLFAPVAGEPQLDKTGIV
jgi:dipeptidyl aminopeptidase/acylaminoacyl peptidase